MAYITRTKIMSALVLLSGIFTSVYLIGGEEQKNNKEQFFASIEAIKNGDSFLDYKKSYENAEILGAASLGNKDNAPSNKNLTEVLTKLYLSEVAKKNPNILGSQTVTLPQEKTLEDFLASQINTGIQPRNYSEKDIRISKISGLEIEVGYLESLASSIDKNFKNVSGGIDKMLQDLLEKKDPSSLKNYLSAAENQISDLLTIETPRSLVGLHLEMLNLWEKKVFVYGAIIDIESDPLKSYLALQSIESVVSENESLDKKLSDFIKDIKS